MVEATMRPLMPQPVMLVDAEITYTCGHTVHAVSEVVGRDAAIARIYDLMEEGEEHECPPCEAEVA